MKEKRFRTLREFDTAYAAMMAKYAAIKRERGWTPELDREYRRESMALYRRYPRNPYAREARDYWREYEAAYEG